MHSFASQPQLPDPCRLLTQASNGVGFMEAASCLLKGSKIVCVTEFAFYDKFVLKNIFTIIWSEFKLNTSFNTFVVGI